MADKTLSGGKPSDDKPKALKDDVAPVKDGVVQEHNPAPIKGETLSQAGAKPQVVKVDSAVNQEPVGIEAKELKVEDFTYLENGAADIEAHVFVDKFGNRGSNALIPLSPPAPHKQAVVERPEREHNIVPKVEGGPVNQVFVDEYGNRGYKEDVHSPTVMKDQPTQDNQNPVDTEGKVTVVKDEHPADEAPKGMADNQFTKALNTKEAK